jgi:hypothetical protein
VKPRTHQFPSGKTVKHGGKEEAEGDLLIG